jgi:hypothetical protein
MNAKAQEALLILKQKVIKGNVTPSTDLEKDLFPYLLDYINSPGKSSATVLSEKLRREAGFNAEIREDPERWENAMRQLLSILLASQKDVDGFSNRHVYAIYEAIKEEIDS